MDANHEDLIGHTVTALGGLPMGQVVERFSTFVSADNPVKLRRQTGQLLYCADMLEYLGLIQPLHHTLAPLVQDGTLRLWGLIGETTYSSAIINSVMLLEMGGHLIGTPTSGSVDHFGSVKSFVLPNSKLKIGHSTKWIDLATLLERAIPYGVEPLTPHVAVTPTWSDYLAGVDTEVAYLLAHGLESLPPAVGEGILTRGGLLTLLHQAAGSPAAAGQAAFWDVKATTSQEKPAL